MIAERGQEDVGDYEEVSLANWLAHLPPSLVAQHLNIPEEVLATFPRGSQAIVPLRWSGPARDRLPPRFSRPAG